MGESWGWGTGPFRNSIATVEGLILADLVSAQVAEETAVAFFRREADFGLLAFYGTARCNGHDEYAARHYFFVYWRQLGSE